jgi:hypothetical protein
VPDPGDCVVHRLWTTQVDVRAATVVSLLQKLGTWRLGGPPLLEKLGT